LLCETTTLRVAFSAESPTHQAQHSHYRGNAYEKRSHSASSFLFSFV
jgi:hypothetical protein